MVPGTTEKDYYLGKVTQAVPEQELVTETAPTAQTVPTVETAP